MATVTLTDAPDPFTAAEVGEMVFAVGVPVEDVPADIVSLLDAVEGFKFEVADGAAAGIADAGVLLAGTTASDGAGGTS